VTSNTQIHIHKGPLVVCAPSNRKVKMQIQFATLNLHKLKCGRGKKNRGEIEALEALLKQFTINRSKGWSKPPVSRVFHVERKSMNKINAH